MKPSVIFIAVFLLSSSCLAQQNNTLVLQQIFDGIYASVGLPAPITVVSCFQEDTIDSIITLINTTLPVINSLNFTAIEALQGTLTNFAQSIPYATQVCIVGNPEIEVLLSGLGALQGSASEVLQRLEGWALQDTELIFTTTEDAEGDFDKEDFSQAGMVLGAMFQQAFTNGDPEDSENEFEGFLTDIEVPLLDAGSTLQQLLNGGFEQAGLSDPTTIVSCLDATTAQNLVSLLGEVLSQAADGTLADISKIEQEIESFVSSVPQAVQACLTGNQEVVSVLKAYNIDIQDPAAVKKKVESYVILHFEAAKKDVGQANSDFQAGNYNTVGKEGGTFAQLIFGSGSQVIMIA